MRWLSRLGSLKVSVVLLALLFLAVLGGTLAQAAWGVAAVQTTFFSKVVFETGGWWFPGLPALLALLGVNLALGAWLHLERSVRTLGLWLVHGALVAFCWGSLGLSLFQDELVLGVVPGATAQQAYLRSDPSGATHELPFRLTLEQFRIETYPGSAEPSDYVSTVRLVADQRETSTEIRMNQPARMDGWTIYQSSVQVIEGQAAPVYKLTHNPAAWFPYAVTLALAAGAVYHLVSRRTLRG